MKTTVTIIFVRWSHYKCINRLFDKKPRTGKMIKQNREQIKSDAEEAWQKYLNETQPSRQEKLVS